MDPGESYGKLLATLAANRKLQSRLQEIMDTAESMLLGVADMQAKLKLLSATENRTGSYSGQRHVDIPSRGKFKASGLGLSKFWVLAGKVPEPNEDTLALLDAYAYLPHTFTIGRWTEENDAALEKSILYVLQEQKHSKTLQSNIAAEGDETQSAGLTSQSGLPDALTREDVTVVDEFTPAQWQSVAVPLAPSWTLQDCSARWVSHTRLQLLSDLQSRRGDQDWSPEEIAKLIQLCEKHKQRHWMLVANELNTGRTPAECLACYQKQESGSGRPWSDEEIQQLRISYAAHSGKGAFWKAVAADIPGRTPQQIMHYWRNKMDATIRKGKWTTEEDQMLQQAVALYGTKWARVAEAVPMRNQIQVRERWVNMLDPQLRSRQAWSEEEDQILMSGLKECKNKDGSVRWAEIARRLPGRTDDAVSNRATTMKRRASRSSKGRAAKPGNTAKRKAEQPVLNAKAKKAKTSGESAEMESLGVDGVTLESPIPRSRPNSLSTRILKSAKGTGKELGTTGRAPGSKGSVAAARPESVKKALSPSEAASRTKASNQACKQAGQNKSTKLKTSAAKSSHPIRMVVGPPQKTTAKQPNTISGRKAQSHTGVQTKKGVKPKVALKTSNNDTNVKLERQGKTRRSSRLNT